MDYLPIIFGFIFFLTGIYISYTAHQNTNSPWHSPWDWVRYWGIVRKTGDKFQKWIFFINIASLVIMIVLLFILS